MNAALVEEARDGRAWALEQLRPATTPVRVWLWYIVHADGTATTFGIGATPRGALEDAVRVALEAWVADVHDLAEGSPEAEQELAARPTVREDLAQVVAGFAVELAGELGDVVRAASSAAGRSMLVDVVRIVG